MGRLVPLEVRFWPKVEKTSTCWLWKGAKHPLGYGHIKINGKVEPAYRIAFEMARGPVPSGLVLDHLCRVPACVNPDHLEAVTMKVNTLRGFSPQASNGRKTHCKRDHEFTAANTYEWNGARMCRTCRRERDAKRGPRRPKPSPPSDRHPSGPAS